MASEQDNKAISALIVALKTIHSYTEWPKKQSNTLLRRASKLRYGEKSGWLTDIAAKKSTNIYGYFYRAPRRARLTQQSAASCIPRPPPAPAHCTPSTSVVKYNTHTHKLHTTYGPTWLPAKRLSAASRLVSIADNQLQRAAVQRQLLHARQHSYITRYQPLAAALDAYENKKILSTKT